jgi:hypothetical protein
MIQNIPSFLSACLVAWWIYTNKPEGMLQLVLMLVVLCSLSSAFTQNTTVQTSPTPLVVQSTSGVRANGEQRTETFYNVSVPASVAKLLGL